jgi:hypothetical protein
MIVALVFVIIVHGRSLRAQLGVGWVDGVNGVIVVAVVVL